MFRRYWQKKSKGVEKKPKVDVGTDRVDPADSERKSVLGSRTDTGRTIEAGDESQQENGAEIHGSSSKIAVSRAELGNISQESCQRDLGVRLYDGV